MREARVAWREECHEPVLQQRDEVRGHRAVLGIIALADRSCFVRFPRLLQWHKRVDSTRTKQNETRERGLKLMHLCIQVWSSNATSSAEGTRQRKIARTILRVSLQSGSGTPTSEFAIAVIVSMKYNSPLWSGTSMRRMSLSSCALLAAGFLPAKPSGVLSCAMIGSSWCDLTTNVPFGSKRSHVSRNS